MNHISEAIQLAIIIALVWYFYKKLIQNTASEKLVRGILGLVLLWVFSFVCIMLRVDLLGGFLHWVALFLSISLIVKMKLNITPIITKYFTKFMI